MSEQHCFVCASNEGVFLDIFTYGKNYRENIETCLSLKIQKRKILSSKICHKCAYEMDQCSKFVGRYKKTNRSEKGKLFEKRGFCSLCMEPGKKDYIFDLWSKNPQDNSVEKLEELFQIDFMLNNSSNLSICLTCRYNLDVLFDLNCIFKDTSRNLQDILNGDMTLSELPKISTSVVRRKTTLTRMSKLSESMSSIFSDVSTVIIEPQTRMPILRSDKSSPQERQCHKCNVKIENGIDMYRYHHTGNTVCKDCWMTLDPHENTEFETSKSTRKAAKTKLCSVFLKDILSNSSETKINDQEIEKNKDNEIIYVLSSDENDNVNENKTLSTRLRKSKRKQQHVTESETVKKLRTYPKASKIVRSSSAQNINETNTRVTRETHSKINKKSESDSKIIRKRPNTVGKSSAATSKHGSGLQSVELRSRPITIKKRTRNKSICSLSTTDNVTPSKLRRFSSSSSYKIDLSASKSDNDTDNNEPYKCKICSIEYENKIIGLTHELTHSKKLEVLLEKVALPEIAEENKTIEREPSTEFESPAVSHDEPTDTSDCHLISNNDSTSQEASDAPQDDSDNNEPCKNTQAKVISNNENQNKKDEDGKAKNNDEEINNDVSKNMSTTDESIGGANDEKINNKNKEINDEIDNKKKEINDETDNTSNEKINNETRPTDVKAPIETADVNVQSTETVELTSNEINTKSPEKESHEEGEVDDNEDVTEIAVPESTNKIDNEKDKLNCEDGEQVKDDLVLQSEVFVNDNEKLDKEENEDEVKINEELNSGSEKKKVEEDKDDGGKETNLEEKNEDENNSNEPISNGNIHIELSDTDETENNEKEINISEGTEFDELTKKSNEHPDVDLNKTEDEVENISKDKIDEKILSTEGETVSKDINTGNNINNKNRRESMDLEEKMAEIVGENIPKQPAVIEETKSTEENSLSELSTTKNIDCKS